MRCHPHTEGAVQRNGKTTRLGQQDCCVLQEYSGLLPNPSHAEINYYFFTVSGLRLIDTRDGMGSLPRLLKCCLG